MTSHLPDSLGVLLNESTRLLNRRFDQRAREFGLTRAQWQLLKQLFRSEGINQAGLAERMDIEPISLCRLADRMEEAGWIERRPDPDDRRARRLFMTEKSLAVLGTMRALAEGIYAEALEGLTPDEAHRFVAALAHVRNNLSRRRGADADGTED